ncbi:hypothetical protein PGT21_010008 [Puccinia graminis f. sp. tritici]|uniref:Uncharacterized protein n=1 Tax=Puccinia graminis f. sp. tritici TaxID=56615 RepID=A0A5B0PQV9_PUCGR|nr:hypothetical protein PGT21_010008 [Puccinia graminis f. sp. tritici]KAA1128250.1 hypothetical protein PGTUg99_016671 [Puccinia graminis f. sp. tritici]
MRYAGADLISLPWSACVLHRNSTNSNFNSVLNQLELQFRTQPTRTSIPYSTNSNFNSVLNQLELQFRTQPTRTSIPYSTNSNFNSVLNQLKLQFCTQDSSSFSFQDSRFLNLPGSPLYSDLNSHSSRFRNASISLDAPYSIFFVGSRYVDVSSIGLAVGSSSHLIWFVVRCDSWSSWNLQGAF